MAQRVVIQLKDDLNGSEATRTVTFGYDGTQYEIDLSQQNLDRLDKSLAPFIEHGRKIGGRRRGTGGTRAVDTKAVRQWAREKGLEISDRGRVPTEIVKQYEQDVNRKAS